LKEDPEQYRLEWVFVCLCGFCFFMFSTPNVQNSMFTNPNQFTM
jgi:hypothetical protein